MNPIGLSTSMMTTGRVSDSAFNFSNLAEGRLALANRVTGNETPEQIAAIQQQDKAMSLKQVQEKFNYEYNSAWQEANARRSQKNREQKQRLMQAGAIFA